MIHGLSESEDALESEEETYEILSNFLGDGLNIDQQSIKFIDFAIMYAVCFILIYFLFSNRLKSLLSCSII